MRGATVEPELKMITLLSRTRQMIMGNNQNFFLSLMKDQSSNKNSSIMPPLTSVVSCDIGSSAGSLSCSRSVLPREMRRRSRPAADPVGLEIGSQFASHRIFADQTAEYSNRRYYEIENTPENNPRINPPQQVPNPHPSFIGVGQACRENRG